MHSKSRGAHRVVAIVLFLGLLVMLTVGFAACGTDTSGVGSSETTAGGKALVAADSSATAGLEPQLTVSAASSLKAAFTEIGASFDRANNSKTTFNFDASGTLQKQIESGASVDVFASAALKQMNALVAEKLVDGSSVEDFAGNEIVLVVPAGSTLGITNFQDLVEPSVTKITYGDPKVAPHGVAAEEVLTALGLLNQVKPKVIYAANVSTALKYVSSGEVDAGIVFATEAKGGGDKVKVVATSDSGWHSQIGYPVGAVSSSRNKNLAHAFVDYVAGAEGQKILRSYGFLAAPARPASTQ